LAELQEEDEPDIISEVGGIFLTHAPDKIAAIIQAASERDSQSLVRAAHSLKSSSAYMGALRLSAMCKELEEQARAGVLEGTERKARLLSEEFLRVKLALENEIESRKRI